MVIGGLAVLVRGTPRLTRDVDLSLLLRPRETQRLLDALGREFRALPSDPVAFARRQFVLPLEGPDGTRLDAAFTGTPFEEESIRRATFEEIGGVRARVCTAEDLVLHKVVSERLQDLEDVRSVVRARGKRFNRKRLDPLVRSLAEELDRPDIAEFWESLFRKGRRR